MPRFKKPRTGWKFGAVTTHPGVVLLEEFLKPLQISQHKLAMDIHVPATRIGEIVHGLPASQVAFVVIEKTETEGLHTE